MVVLGLALGSWLLGACGGGNPATPPSGSTSTGIATATGTTSTTGTIGTTATTTGTTTTATTGAPGTTSTTGTPGTTSTTGTTPGGGPDVDDDGDGWTENEGDCDDTDPSAWPGAKEVCGDGVQQDCGGDPWTCTGLGHDMGMTDADLRVLAGSQVGALGAELRVVGDMDGDGAADLLVGAPQSDLAAPGGGSAHLLRATGSGEFLDADAEIARLVDGVAYDLAGLSLGGGLDLTGDGDADLAVGSIYSSRGSSAGGTVFLLPGPASGTVDLDAGSLQFVGVHGDDHVGAALDFSPDLTGDGWPDLALAAEYAMVGGVDWVGAFFVLAGPLAASGVAEDLADATILGEGTYRYVEARLQAGSDLDGDGAPDLVVAARNDDAAADAAGAVHVFSGPLPTVQSWSDADVILQGEGEWNRFGEQLAPPHDVDGDGYPDLLIGAGAWGADDNGRVYLLLGPPGTGVIDPASAADLLLDGDAGNQLGKWAVAMGPGLDGSTRADLVVTTNGDRIGVHAGKAWIVPGDVRGTDTASHAAIASVVGTTGDEMGWALALADVGADGLPDLVLGASGYDSAYGGEGAVVVFRGMGF